MDVVAAAVQNSKVCSLGTWLGSSRQDKKMQSVGWRDESDSKISTSSLLVGALWKCCGWNLGFVRIVNKL